jgi:hypothetical protein
VKTKECEEGLARVERRERRVKTKEDLEGLARGERRERRVKTKEGDEGLARGVAIAFTLSLPLTVAG